MIQEILNRILSLRGFSSSVFQSISDIEILEHVIKRLLDPMACYLQKIVFVFIVYIRSFFLHRFNTIEAFQAGRSSDADDGYGSPGDLASFQVVPFFEQVFKRLQTNLEWLGRQCTLRSSSNVK